MSDSDTDETDGLDAIAASIGTVGCSDGRLRTESRAEKGEQFGYDG